MDIEQLKRELVMLRTQIKQKRCSLYLRDFPEREIPAAYNTLKLVLDLIDGQVDISHAFGVLLDDLTSRVPEELSDDD